MKTGIKLTLSLLLMALLTACMGIGTKDEEDIQHFYVIDVDRGSVAAEFVKNRVLRIKPVKVTSHFSGKQIVFRIGENEYQSQHNHEFFTQPDELFTEHLKKWMQKTGLFSHIVIDDASPADMVLETAVTALYGDNREQFSPQAVLEMQFFLTKEAGDSSQALFQTGLRVDIDIEETTAANVVKAWNLGLVELLATVEDDFSGFFSKRNP
ncbi:MAG: ABC transporter [Gammaproteobacteria bacterium]|nr:MAG: ABC transporter [Gammaproteobacteria bacterium]